MRLIVLVEAVKLSAIPAGQIAADCSALDLPTFLTLVDDFTHGRLYVENGKVIRDYSKVKGTR